MLRTGSVWHFQGRVQWGFPTHSDCGTPEVTSEAGRAHYHHGWAGAEEAVGTRCGVGLETLALSSSP